VASQVLPGQSASVAHEARHAAVAGSHVYGTQMRIAPGLQ
jgi:hypothetical protein